MESLRKHHPAFLMSFWRSGSNFVANVISASCKLSFETMYHPELPLVNADLSKYIMIKSHAPSYAHLLAELGAFCPAYPGLPHRFIVLWRDPRDMMISFYDWMCARLNEDIPQRAFIHDLRYGYAVAGMGHASLADTFRGFVQNWTTQRELHNMRSYHFEKILEDKHAAFSDMLAFLGLECALEESAFEKKIKLGRSKRAQRGTAGAFRQCADTYGILLEEVVKHLGPEIKLLGYVEE